MNLQLVNDIQNDREGKNLANGLPALLKQLFAIVRSGKQSPKIRGLSSFCVFDPVNHRENSRHQRLHDNPKMKRAVKAREKVVDHSLQFAHVSAFSLLAICQGQQPSISTVMDQLRTVRNKINRPKLTIPSRVGVTVTVPMMSAATKNSSPNCNAFSTKIFAR